MKSLRAQLTFRLVAGGVLLLVLTGVLLHWQMRRALTAEFDASIMATLQTVTMMVEQKRGHVSIDLTGADVSQLERPNGAEIFLLRSPDGHEITRSASLGTARLPLRVGAIKTPDFFNTKLGDGRVMRCAGIRFTPEYEDETPRPPQVDALLTVGLTRAPLDRALAAVRASLLLVASGALVLLGIIVYWSVRAGLAPLDRLGASVAAVNAASLATRFPVEPLPSELQPIVVRLNQLLARLESAFARERRFTATAAHELRTPLAELRSLAEVSLTTPGSMTENRQSWRDALETTLRMESLALRLLDLARAENSEVVLQPASISLTRAVAAAWQPWAHRASDRGIVPQLAVAPELRARTDPSLLAVILGNLCANAVEHAPAGTAVTVQGNQAKDGVSLLFQNQAGALTAADLPHLFERFWRKDGARSDGNHHGLGLSLAAEFAAVLRGTLTARITESDAVEFKLWLPETNQIV